MLTATLEDILSKTGVFLALGDHELYIVRDGKTVLYVGQTICGIEHRLWTHIHGGYGSEPSRLGRLVLANMPASQAWQVEALTMDECLPLAQMIYPELKCLDLSTTENILIQYYRPCLNVANNPDPSPLPEKYADPDDHRDLWRDPRVRDAMKAIKWGPQR